MHMITTQRHQVVLGAHRKLLIHTCSWGTVRDVKELTCKERLEGGRFSQEFQVNKKNGHCDHPRQREEGRKQLCHIQGTKESFIIP